MPPAPNLIHTVKSHLPPSPGGEPTLLFRKLEAKEELSRPFHYQVELLSKEDGIDPADLLGKPISVSVAMPSGDGGSAQVRSRHFHGIVTRFSYHGRAEGYSEYHAVLRPWYWLLSRNFDCRIFQNMTVPEIFEKVCRDTHGFSDFRLSLVEQYRKREFCVQYRERDFAFLSRLLEEEGIFYYFEQTEDKHTLVLGDANSAFKVIDGPEEIPYRPPGESHTDIEHIFSWHVGHEVQTGAYVHDDYDFTKPRVDLEGRAATRQHDYKKFETYDYPGIHWEASDGEKLAKIRMEEVDWQYKVNRAMGDHRGLEVGRTFKLTEYPRTSENGEYAIVSTTTTVDSAEIEQMRSEADNRFEVELTALPKAVPFRPLRVTKKPFVHGPQTAVVVGKQGEEIWTDKYARVKLQFHWDREGQSDENSSCWIRVSQHWAGKNWGSIHIPRIGQEVVVDFLEGDPDRPLVTGRVYNDSLMPPYGLPDNQTQSGVLSRSTKNGTPENFNELRFEDKKDEEKVYFHAEKDFERVVENDDILKVGFEKKSPGSQTIEIHKDRTAEIKTGNDSTTVAQGNHSLKVSAGTSTIEAAQKITLKVGGSTITIEPAKITLSSPEIAITGNAKVSVSAPMTEASGSATLMLSGGIVKIN